MEDILATLISPEVRVKVSYNEILTKRNIMIGVPAIKNNVGLIIFIDIDRVSSRYLFVVGPKLIL